MGRKKIRKPAKQHAVAQQPTPPTQDELDTEMKSDVESDSPIAKDATELELEKLVFGDNAGFREGLKAHTRENLDLEIGSDRDGSHDEAQEEDGEGLEIIDDADLFFLDSGPSATGEQALIPTFPSEGEDSTTKPVDEAAWEDSEDDRIMVSLASNPRLRKLRISETEDIVNGKEYSKRLRRQFERLNPVPDWALQEPAPSTSKRKKRRKPSGAVGRLSQEPSSSENDMEVDDEDGQLSAQPLAKFLQNPSALTASASSRHGRLILRPEVLDIQRTPDIPGTQPSAITTLEFHPQYPSLLLTSGPSSLLSLYHLSTVPSPTLLTSLHLRSSSSLSTAAFLPPGGLAIYLSTLQKRHFHIWDLPSGTATKVSRVYGHRREQRNMARFKLSPCGRWIALLSSTGRGGAASEGAINILDAGTTQWIAQAQLESPSTGAGAAGMADFSWWRDGDGFSIALKSGEIGEYHVPSRRFLARWIGDGVTGTTTIALGGAGGPTEWGGDRYLAIGSTSGMVDIYDRRAVHKHTSESSSSTPAAHSPTNARTQPLRSLGHLTTPTSNLLFSPDGQVLVMSSRWKSDALKLVHLPSCTVYRNWPTDGTPLGRVTSVAWAWVVEGRDGKQNNASTLKLGVGNEAGKVRLWEVRG
ncbi:MAG: hypothetical protein M1837_006077 [Sclerophora amabilis]|nr:MAG: hypothetical protein M1837_006077 [Sclerophora amabilis]